MRRALRGIVPVEILERRRKASLIRSPLAALQREETRIRSIFNDSILSQYGYIDEISLLNSLSTINRGVDSRGWSAVFKAVLFEFWIRSRQSNLLKLAPARATNKSWRHKNGVEEIRIGDVVL